MSYKYQVLTYVRFTMTYQIHYGYGFTFLFSYIIHKRTYKYFKQISKLLVIIEICCVYKFSNGKKKDINQKEKYSFGLFLIPYNQDQYIL